MMKSHIVIIGVGSIGTRHLRNLLALGASDIALSDPSREKLRAASRFGNFRAYTDERRALAVEKPEIVFVCNPTDAHVRTALYALRKGAHVFIEKPISHSLAGVDALIREARKKKRTCMVACNFRFRSGFQRLEQALRKRMFGAPLFARVTLGYFLPAARAGVSYAKTYAATLQGGGVVLDSGSHVADYLTALFGKIETGAMLKGKTRFLKMQSEETAALVFRHESGLVSSVALDYLSRRPAHRLEVVTERGLLTLDIRRNALTFEDEKVRKTVYAGERDPNAMFLAELKHFLACVKHKRKPIQTFADAREVLRVLLSNHVK